ncbi:MAG: hypothetical protein OEZ13_05505 [Spirochaetia bacterium]|nr:hypothetical protein [Spirochaetia bacterium]
MDWQNTLSQAIQENKIRELYLYKVPVLKTCDNWAAVKELGRVSFKGKHATYNGALVKYAESLYFVPEARIEALAPYRKWNLKNTIDVISEEDFKKQTRKK